MIHGKLMICFEDRSNQHIHTFGQLILLNNICQLSFFFLINTKIKSNLIYET